MVRAWAFTVVKQRFDFAGTVAEKLAAWGKQILPDVTGRDA